MSSGSPGLRRDGAWAGGSRCAGTGGRPGWGPTPGPATAAGLGRAAAVVRHRGDVLDGAHLEACGLERADGGLAARARALHEDVDLLHAVLLRLAGAVLGGHLRGERRRLARALEAHVAGGGPADDVALGGRDRGGRAGAGRPRGGPPR